MTSQAFNNGLRVRVPGRAQDNNAPRKCKYMLSTFCVDNSVDELFLTAPGRRFT